MGGKHHGTALSPAALASRFFDSRHVPLASMAVNTSSSNQRGSSATNRRASGHPPLLTG